MKAVLTIFAFLLCPLLFSCDHPKTQNGSDNKQKPTAGSDAKTLQSNTSFTVDIAAISKDFATWYNYTYANIRLAQDFIGLDVDSTIIQKGNFLARLESGNFIPLRVRIQQNVPVYKLFKANNSDKDIELTVKQMAAIEREHFNMEGKPLPTYDFKDLNGRQYNKTTTRGKTLLLKCWFIKCFACVQEFPELNKLVDNFKGRNNWLFISLASDSEHALSSFLQKKPFNYAVVAGQGTYMSEQLGVTAYPTHVLVDKTGKIIKVTNSIDDMLPFVEKQVGKDLM